VIPGASVVRGVSVFFIARPSVFVSLEFYLLRLNATEPGFLWVSAGQLGETGYCGNAQALLAI
ncbi:hypothetical protein, partial [Paraburkholderia humisilvae]|uniref:hypothetical protein n=1 Tax=Paraburkholderia humisilvae TaxID=627669 RepID=UPI001C2E6CE1